MDSLVSSGPTGDPLPISTLRTRNEDLMEGSNAGERLSEHLTGRGRLGRLRVGTWNSMSFIIITS